MSQTIRIVLADDHSLVRDGIRALLEEEEDLVVVAEVSNGKEAIDMVNEKKPDLLIIDIRMPVMNGIDAVEILNKQGTETKTIILSMHDSEEYILKSVSAGANGYLLKDTGKTEFIKAIRTVQHGGKYFSGDISNVLVNNLLSGSKPVSEKPKHIKSSDNPFDLTSKELQILELILSGLTNKQISEKLENSKRTVETHRFNLMRKMDVKNLIDLSKKAQEFNLV
ncbi:MULTISPECIES: response regulator transcription factor [Cellulophaga]|jgi:DNA-binding NarL/FixJ family response regulator|uniref:Two component transcriptional regulator, LuxR family n=1 Tax=Cellulophaga baltica TaxID=76594 RepID=A0A1G7FE44_9FLAO|nr:MULTISPECIES: response regulator transcription factor [Cellulophaga]WFO15119.1 response regulator transcription factor [Cellulophaga baltica 4]KGK31262.1 LuxR family transcriptional regulator [Cellulophaga sp. E6(2014)]MBA6313942.1 response regulator transcription factor [Cellulophaga baltica]MCR1025729.1 response regulator transcription factor [Cellulophaga baltica]SDE74213.1 two component transcriptional regulator, LuxR family [Cellulophaga baltica]